jgi:hypothetical protein
MARKSSRQAERQHQQREFNVWRLLIRNPDFLQDLQAFRKLRAGWQVAKSREALASYHSQETRLCDKWGLLRLPPVAVEVSWTSPEDLEDIYRSYRHYTFPLTVSPVFVEGVKDDRFLFLRLDTSLPREDVLAALDGEVRQFYKTREVTSSRRGRPDKLDNQLAIYDRVEEMRRKSPKARFDIVAQEMGKPASTIRGAYWSIYYKIRSGQKPTSQTIQDPGPVDECPDPRCRKACFENDHATAVKMLCPAHRKTFAL